MDDDETPDSRKRKCEDEKVRKAECASLTLKSLKSLSSLIAGPKRALETLNFEL
jgi:hypothetical protein